MTRGETGMVLAASPEARVAWRARNAYVWLLGLTAALAFAAALVAPGSPVTWSGSGPGQQAGGVPWTAPSQESRSVYYLVDSPEQAESVTRTAATQTAQEERTDGPAMYRPVILMASTPAEESSALRAIAYANEVRRGQGLSPNPVVDLRTR